MSGVKIRLMDVADVAQCLAIADASSLSFWSRDGYLSELDRTDSIALVALSEPVVLGFIVGRVVADTEAEVYNIGVRVNSRKQGIGRKLLDSFANNCRNHNIHSIWLEVRESNSTAIWFYEAAGFTQVSVRKGFYSDPPEDAILMNKKM
jgi:ribosomal-protein-alanine N-acetyltransferase